MELATIVRESLDDILRTFFGNGFRSVFYNVVEQAMVDLLRKDAIAEMLHDCIAKL